MFARTSPVTVELVTFAVVVVTSVHGPKADEPRYTWKPVSLSELSFQRMGMLVRVAPPPDRTSVGARGSRPGVVVEAMFDQAEF